MSSEQISIIVRHWYDSQTGTRQVRVIRTNTPHEVHFGDGSFLIRVSVESSAPVTRCLIRHLESGREAYIQGGPNLLAFIKESLLH